MKKIGYLCLYISSLFKFLGKRFLSPKTCIVDPLSIPGFFVLNYKLLYRKSIDDPFFKIGTCSSWEYYDMPDAWCEKINYFKKKGAGSEKQNHFKRER